MKAPVGVTTAHSESKKAEMVGKIATVIPDKKLADALKGKSKKIKGIIIRKGCGFETCNLLINEIIIKFMIIYLQTRRMKELLI